MQSSIEIPYSLEYPAHREYSEDNARRESFGSVDGIVADLRLGIETCVAVGLFYHAESFRVRCFCCDFERLIVDAVDVVTEHRRRSPSCAFLLSLQQTRRSDRSSFTGSLGNLVHPNYGTRSTRRDSFTPVSLIVSTIPNLSIEQCADTGLFYHAESFRVRCFCCDFERLIVDAGGVVTEHRRLSPNCAFLLSLQNSTAEDLNLQGTAMANQHRVVSVVLPGSVVNNDNLDSDEDFVDLIPLINAMREGQAVDSEPVVPDYPLPVVVNPGPAAPSRASETLVNPQGPAGRRMLVTNNNNLQPVTVPSQSQPVENDLMWREQYENLKKTCTCICVICFVNKRDCLFLPCCHFAVCHNCGSSDLVTRCCLCRAIIAEKRKIFSV